MFIKSSNCIFNICQVSSTVVSEIQFFLLSWSLKGKTYYHISTLRITNCQKCYSKIEWHYQKTQKNVEVSVDSVMINHPFGNTGTLIFSTEHNISSLLNYAVFAKLEASTTESKTIKYASF